MDADLRQLSRRAEETARSLALQASHRAPPRGLGRALRLAVRIRQVVTRKLETLLREHWDIGVFDVLFGSVKAFGVYPALYFAGLAWSIPLMEAALLNTQLWTAGYLVARGKLLSELGRRRYGHPLEELDALCDRLLRVTPRDARHVHRFVLDGQPRRLRVRRSRVRAWLARWRGEREEDVVLQSELRSWVDPEFRFLANPLRANPYFYELVVLANLLATPEAHGRLLGASLPDEPVAGEERALRATLGGAPMTVIARVAEQADALGAVLAGRLGRTPSTRCLRWIHASLGRAVRARLGELEDLRYRVLADRFEGQGLLESPSWRALCRKRAEVRAWVARAGRFARLAGRLRSEADARRLAGEALRDARSRGLTARRASFAAWLAGVEDVWSPVAVPAQGIGA